ncbi:hypothetical protein EJ04DRAFT_83480 [Polyplosphaeria fusca]|uniref:Uncharacterized protein n=1 Tax=Polyplosphaeria fusca TaxID=682080 RepID=A0A9P4UUK0_9PLEO|nr:hypothetical protein EJ04DRAFT_83480 [Polyplosphaeria fusca]
MAEINFAADFPGSSPASNMRMQCKTALSSQAAAVVISTLTCIGATSRGALRSSTTKFSQPGQPRLHVSQAYRTKMTLRAAKMTSHPLTPRGRTQNPGDLHRTNVISTLQASAASYSAQTSSSRPLEASSSCRTHKPLQGVATMQSYRAKTYSPTQIFNQSPIPFSQRFRAPRAYTQTFPRHVLKRAWTCVCCEQYALACIGLASC